jgi:hypothetical protein
MNIHLNCKKGQSIKGKTTKSANTFCRNKPNSPIVQMNVTFFATMNYVISTSLTKVKNKPNTNPIQTQLKPIKAKTNPIKAKTNPIQTQFKPNYFRSISALNFYDCFIRLFFGPDSGKMDNWLCGR